MTREAAERTIRSLFLAELSAAAFSNKLFTPDGLFNQIAHNEQERREVVKTELWRDAMVRLRELQYQDAATLADVTRLIGERLPSAAYRVWLEPIETI